MSDRPQPKDFADEAAYRNALDNWRMGIPVDSWHGGYVGPGPIPLPAVGVIHGDSFLPRDQVERYTDLMNLRALLGDVLNVLPPGTPMASRIAAALVKPISGCAEQAKMRDTV